MAGKEVKCTTCNKLFNSEDAQIICSNCFACKGCKRYFCPHCNEAIVIEPVKAMFEDFNVSPKNEAIEE